MPENPGRGCMDLLPYWKLVQAAFPFHCISRGPSAWTVLPRSLFAHTANPHTHLLPEIPQATGTASALSPAGTQCPTLCFLCPSLPPWIWTLTTQGPSICFILQHERIIRLSIHPSQFTSEETETWRGEDTCSESHSWSGLGYLTHSKTTLTLLRAQWGQHPMDGEQCFQKSK